MARVEQSWDRSDATLLHAPRPDLGLLHGDRKDTAERLVGVTGHAARALGMQTVVGTIEIGKWCDLAVWDVEQPSELVFNLGHTPLYERVWHGQVERAQSA